MPVWPELLMKPSIRVEWVSTDYPGLARRGGDRATDSAHRGLDHVGDDVGPGDHDHVRALDLGDGGAGALGHRSDHVRARRLVARRDDGPGRQGLPGGWS